MKVTRAVWPSGQHALSVCYVLAEDECCNPLCEGFLLSMVWGRGWGGGVVCVWWGRWCFKYVKGEVRGVGF